MTAAAATFPNIYFTDANGVPLSGGLLYAYLSGTTTPTPTWMDQSLSTYNTNPIVLDSKGSCVVWLDSSIIYKFILTNSVGAQQWSQDNIIGDGINPSIALSTAVLSIYQGAFSVDPAIRVNGAALQNGDLYFNTNTNRMLAYANGTWYATESAGATDAALVSYTPAGTGAVPTTVQAKLWESVSVLDFGALSSNTNAQNKTALQTAIVDVSNAGGGTVLVPADINYGYKVSNPTTYPDFSVLTTGDVVVEDRSAANNENSGKPGAQVRYFYGTIQTTPTKGQHNGNGMVATGNWHPYYMIINSDPDLTETNPYRATFFAQAEKADGTNMDVGYGIGDVVGEAAGADFEKLASLKLFTAGKFIWNTSTAAWYRTAGSTLLGCDRYSGCWAMNDTVSRSYAFKFRLPDGIHSSEISYQGDTAALAPNFGLVNLADARDFKIRAMTGDYSYKIVAHNLNRLLFDINGWTHITDGSSALTTSVHSIEKFGLSEGNEFLIVIAAGFNQTARFFATTNAGSNGGATGIRVGTNSVTSRSINAGGTINASGADYAEYENNGGLTIAKGDIVGFKADGTLTLTYAEAVRFGIKSTNPSYVGGDSWGADLEGEALEQARTLVDRIAYSGKVPCNVTGATPGGYIIAADNGGEITGVFVADPDFSQYKKAVGRVNRILPDGRAEVAVIVH